MTPRNETHSGNDESLPGSGPWSGRFPRLAGALLSLLTIAFFGLAACDGAAPTGPGGESIPAEISEPSGSGPSEDGTGGSDSGAGDNQDDDTASGTDSGSNSGAGSDGGSDEDTSGGNDGGDSGGSTGSDSGSTDGGSTDSDAGSTDGGNTASPYPNQPNGFSKITETTFRSLTENGWRASESTRLAKDSSAPKSPGSVGEALFPKGFSAGSSPIWAEKGITSSGVKKLYVSFWLKLSSNWQGNQINDKIGYLWTHEKPVVFPAYVGGGSGPLHSQIRIQGVPDGARNFASNKHNPEIHRGQWHRWEILVVSNTGGAEDGEIHWWLDGKKVGEYRGVRFGDASQSKVWNTVAWRPVWGGRKGTVQQDQRMWMDHIYVSGAR